LLAEDLPWIRVGTDQRTFVDRAVGKPFVAWGFNYDHDETGRLIEDYWDAEWPKVEADFQEMKDLGANVVRVHLQFGKFMESADKPNEKSLDQLARLVSLAEKVGLYLDVTGLGCYHKKDVPAWYDALEEAARWEAQARFWEAVAAPLYEEPGDLLLRPDERAGRARQQSAKRRTGSVRPSATNTSCST
jgi:sugar phosphate isomerase/epimerase